MGRISLVVRTVPTISRRYACSFTPIAAFVESTFRTGFTARRSCRQNSNSFSQRTKRVVKVPQEPLPKQPPPQLEYMGWTAHRVFTEILLSHLRAPEASCVAAFRIHGVV